MNKKEKRGLEPVLRFPEFRSEGKWSIKKLGTIFTERQEKGFANLPLLSLTDKEGIVPQEETNRVNHSSSDKSKYLRVCFGDIAYNTMRMWEGRSAFVNVEGLVSPAYTVCQPNDGTDGLFFSYYFKTNQLIREFFRYSQGLVKDTLNLKYETFANIETSVPSLPEQQKIAECLTSLDELTTAQSQKLDALKSFKKSLMQQLFPAEGETMPKIRFPEFQDKGEWKRESFDTIYSFENTNSLSRDMLNDKQGIVKNIHYGDIHTRLSTLFDINKEVVSYIDSIELSEKIKPESFCVEGDVIFADASEDTDDVGKCIEIVSLNNERLVSGMHTILARQIAKKLIIGFGGYLFKSNRIRDQIKKEAQGTKVFGISARRLSTIDVVYPLDEKEQQKIVYCLTSLDELIAAHIKKLDALKAHKKGLMQQLFPNMDEVGA